VVLVAGSLLVGVAAGVPALVVAAAVLLVPLLLPAGPTPTTVTIHGGSDGRALLVGDGRRLRIDLRLDAPAEVVRARLSAVAGVRTAGGTAAAADTAALTVTPVVTATRWGRRPDPTVLVEVRYARGLRMARAQCPLPLALLALPRPRPIRPGSLRLLGRTRSGDHTQRRAGAGAEFHGLRPYVPGDRLRDVHWAASSRRDEPYVALRDADAAVDVVLALDLLARGGRAEAAQALGVEGAVSLGRMLCNGADRTGLIGLGALLAWTPPGTGVRHWYRLAATAATLQARESYVAPDLQRIPPAVLPTYALVVLFSPLLDPRIRGLVADLRRRRHPVLVIDTAAQLSILTATQLPRGGHRPLNDLAVRLAALERAAAHSALVRLGCRVVDWDGTTGLDAVLGTSGSAARR
jgi:uncharacterized protein (DUF58 family)